MLLWLSSWLCASCCGDAATAVMRDRDRAWRTSRVFERGPPLVAMVGMWTVLISLMCGLTGLLWFTFGLVMQEEPAWPNARVWAPVAAVPMFCAGVVLAALLTELLVLLAWRRWWLRNGLQPLKLERSDTDTQGLTAMHVSGAADDEDNSRY